MVRVPFLAFLRASDSCRVLLIAEFSQVTLVQQVQGLSRSSSETFSDTVSVAVHSEDTLLVRGGKLSHVLWDACSRAHPGSMGLRMGAVRVLHLSNPGLLTPVERHSRLQRSTVHCSGLFAIQDTQPESSQQILNCGP